MKLPGLNNAIKDLEKMVSRAAILTAGKGRWKAALSASEITFDRRLSASQNLTNKKALLTHPWVRQESHKNDQLHR